MSKDIQNYRDTHNGVSPLWTTTMFGGMPGYQIATNNNNYVSYYANEIFSFFIPKPFRFFILACLGFYFLGWVLRFNPWLSIMGALAFAYSSYDPIIVAVGHDTKMLSIAYVPACIGSHVPCLSEKILAWRSADRIVQLHPCLSKPLPGYLLLYLDGSVCGRSLPGRLHSQQTGASLGAFHGNNCGSGLAGVLANAVMLFTTYDYAKKPFAADKPRWSLAIAHIRMQGKRGP